ncbi:c-type cytochrome biogenesis protein CcsB [Motilibacter peucedani]
MAVYALAMVCYFVELAVGEVVVPAAAPVPAPVAAASGGSTITLAEPPVAVPAVPRGERWGRTAVSLTVLAFVLHAAGVVTRGLAAGRAPWGNMYEFAITATLAASGVLLLGLRSWRVRAVGAVVVPVLLLLLGLAVTVLYTDAEQLVPALQSYWLWIHVTAATLAAGGFTLGAAFTVLQMARSRAESRGRTPRWAVSLPASEQLERMAYRAHVFAFPVFTFAVMAGAIWAENAWGRYWGWDPKETWSFITWVFYAAALHARATAGWRGRGSGVLALLGFAALMFNLFGVNIWITGLHSYAGV